MAYAARTTVSVEKSRSGETVGSWLAPQMDAAYDPDKGVMPTGLRLALEPGEPEED